MEATSTHPVLVGLSTAVSVGGHEHGKEVLHHPHFGLVRPGLECDAGSTSDLEPG